MDITTALQRLSLQSRRTRHHLHVLYLEYPVTSLIPNRPGIGLRMEPPKHASYREKTNAEKYFLAEQGLDFYVRFPVAKAGPPKRESTHCSKLNHAVSRLAQSGGRSTLEAVTVSEDNNGERGYIFRLATLWHYGGSRQVQEFQVSDEEWSFLLTLDNLKPWTTLLTDLFSRASDRAYLHVERQLQGSEHLAVDALRWDLYEILTANRLLAMNMREVREQGTLLCLTPIRDFFGDCERVMTVRLPCEHECNVSIAWIKALSLAQCIDMACPRCGRTVLPTVDIVYAHNSVERRRRQRKAIDEILWRRVEASNHGRDTIVEVSGATILQALAHALWSLQVPESVSPRQLCPAWSAEAAAILDDARMTFGNPIRPITLGDVHGRLMRFVNTSTQRYFGMHDTDMSEYILPGWKVFVRRWLERTSSLVAIPGYAGQDVWAVSGEVPDDDICFDDQEEILGGDVDIGIKLGAVSLI